MCSRELSHIVVQTLERMILTYYVGKYRGLKEFIRLFFMRMKDVVLFVLQTYSYHFLDQCIIKIRSKKLFRIFNLISLDVLNFALNKVWLKINI